MAVKDTFIGKSLDKSLLWRLLREGMGGLLHLYIPAIISMFVVGASSAMTAFSMEMIVNAMTGASRSYVLGVGALVLGVFVVKGVSMYVQMVTLARAGNRIVASQQMRLYRKLLAQGIAFYNTHETSDLLTRISNGANAARTVINTIVTSFARDLITLIGLLVVMFYQQPQLSLFSLIMVPAIFFGLRVLLVKVRDIMHKEYSSLAEIIKVIQETSMGIRVIKIFGLEDRLEARMQRAVNAVEKRSNAINRLEAITMPLMEIVTGLIISAVVVISGTRMLGGATASPGQLMSFVTALIMAYEPAKRLSRMRVSIESSMIGVKMLFQLIDAPITMVDRDTARPITVRDGAIELENVSFHYKSGTPTLNDLSISIPARNTIALVGASGGGKSTIMNLLMRFYDVTGGAIRIDGTDVRDATLESLRGAISYVGQETFLFSNSILENIRASRPQSSDDEVIAAAKVAHAHDFISEMPQGYQTPVGENGQFLSGGQRQRLSIARAVLKGAPILLLDEATSALDATSERLIKEALAEITRDVTTVIIAHRLSTVMQADRIFVLEAGRVVQQGAPSDLVEAPGAFRDLYLQQFAAPGGPDRDSEPAAAAAAEGAAPADWTRLAGHG
ncbi:ABC transporter ATP-binding protein [Frigidibacter sp. MR17.14]|uniref:ABC transporter ATP-binding protein n=1 Tax=Frigidibacter sp. MR17.14 TaxID=3126509 RepID=UPI003012EF2F